jgi:hypothetical protein
MWLFRWLRREASVPAPPFKACKRVGYIMYGLWYGRITREQARKQAEEWGFTPDQIDQMIADATQPPSYWSQHTV